MVNRYIDIQLDVCGDFYIQGKKSQYVTTSTTIVISVSKPQHSYDFFLVILFMCKEVVYVMFYRLLTCGNQ